MRILTLTTALALALSAGEALAHARLVKAEPAVGSSVDQAPARIWLMFDQVIRPGASGVMLSSPDGRRIVLSPLSHDPRDPRAVFAPTPTGLGPGHYRIEWRALSPDGHRTQGDFGFTVRR